MFKISFIFFSLISISVCSAPQSDHSVFGKVKGYNAFRALITSGQMDAQSLGKIRMLCKNFKNAMSAMTEKVDGIDCVLSLTKNIELTYKDFPIQNRLLTFFSLEENKNCLKNLTYGKDHLGYLDEKISQQRIYKFLIHHSDSLKKLVLRISEFHKDFGDLRFLKNLQDLQLDCTDFDKRSFFSFPLGLKSLSLSGYGRIRNLNMADLSIEDGSIEKDIFKQVLALPLLEDFSVRCRMLPEDCTLPAQLKSLKISLFAKEIPVSILSQIKGFYQLQSLTLEAIGSMLVEQALQNHFFPKSLVSLTLNFYSIPPYICKAFEELINLKFLNLSGCILEGPLMLNHFLESLNLSSTRHKKEYLKDLALLFNLKKLNLSYNGDFDVTMDFPLSLEELKIVKCPHISNHENFIQGLNYLPHFEKILAEFKQNIYHQETCNLYKDLEESLGIFD